MRTRLAIWFFVAILLSPERCLVTELSHFTLKDRFLPALGFRSLSNVDWSQCLEACTTNTRCISYSFDKRKAPDKNCFLHECGFINECAGQDTLIFSKDCVFQQLKPVEVGVNLL